MLHTASPSVAIIPNHNYQNQEINTDSGLLTILQILTLISPVAMSMSFFQCTITFSIQHCNLVVLSPSICDGLSFCVFHDFSTFEDSWPMIVEYPSIWICLMFSPDQIEATHTWRNTT